MNAIISDIPAGKVTEVPLEALTPDPDQPRKNFEKKALEQLADSIEKRGVLVPILVRKGENGELLIHDGERRYRASQIAKRDQVPIILLAVQETEEDLRTEQLAVNNLRERLSPMEIARLLSSLRKDRFATVNELAAHLDKAGLPPMKPKEIEDAIKLCDLPKPVQKMIDAGQVEASGAAQLHVVAAYPAARKEAIADIKRDIQWRGKATAQDVTRSIRGALRVTGVDLDKTQDWHGSEAVHFNAKAACKGCEHLVNIGGNRFCMSPKDFEKKNAEAKAAGLLPGGKKPAKQRPDSSLMDKPTAAELEQKAESRARSLREKCRDYLHDRLVSRIVDQMLPDAEIDITDELLAWHAMDQPGAAGWSRKPETSMDYCASKQASIGGLEDLLSAKSLDDPKLYAALEIAHSLPWRETQVICRELWGTNLEAVWKLDEDFLALLRKAELLRLVEAHQLEEPEGKAWDKLKLAELREEILERDIARPMILQEIYDDVAVPFTPWNERSWDEDEEDFEE